MGQANSLTYKLTKKTTTPDDINSKAPQLQKPLNQNIINLKVHQNSKAPQLQSPLTQNIINSKAPQLPKPINSKHHQLKSSPTPKPINSKTSSAQKLINSKAPQPKSLNRYLLFYNIVRIFVPF